MVFEESGERERERRKTIRAELLSGVTKKLICDVCTLTDMRVHARLTNI